MQHLQNANVKDCLVNKNGKKNKTDYGVRLYERRDMNLNLGSKEIPINAATKTFAILAKRGAGKSYTGAVMAEEFYKNNIPFIVFDPIDVWWGLRLDKNGRDKGIPVVVFGLEHADIQLNRDMGRQIAQSVVKENVSCIISTFGMPKVAQRHLIAEFSEELLNINNTPRHVFIEEAHEFVPQRVFGGLGKTFNAVSNLVVMGRNRGIGVTLINQRAATINKDVLTQLDTLIAMRLVAPQDRKALKEWVEYHSADGDFEAFMQSLPFLPTGEGGIWSPEFLGIFERIKIRERETFHPDREKLGENFVMPSLEQSDIEEFIKNFSFDPKKAEIKKIVEVKEEKIEPSKEVIALRNEFEGKLIAKDLEIQRLNGILDKIRNILGVSGETASSSILSSNIDMWLQKLGNGGTRRILEFLASKSGMKFTRSQVGLATGLSSKSGSFNTYMATLKRNNLIIEQGGLSQVNHDL